MSMTTQSDTISISELIDKMRLVAGRSGTEEILRLLARFNPYSFEDTLELPLPMMFSDAWEEVLVAIRNEALKA